MQENTLPVKNHCLGQAKPVLAAYRNCPPVPCFLSPCVGPGHYLSADRCQVALANLVLYQITAASTSSAR